MFLCEGLTAQEYFVSTSGNNKNNGKSETKAWRTISYAASKVSSGDIVWIKAGNYGNENVVATHPDHCCACGHCIALCPVSALSHPDLAEQGFVK